MDRKGPELFIALAGAVGTDLNAVYDSLERALHALDYDTTRVHLAHIAHELPEFHAVPEHPLDQYVEGMMNAGDDLRQHSGINELLALLGMGQIQQDRTNLTPPADPKKGTPPVPRRAFIIRSLKHPAEVEACREVYGSNFYLIAAYSPQSTRCQILAKQIAADAGDPLAPDRVMAERIIERDRTEPGKPHGQNLQGTFHLADVFIDAADPNAMNSQIQRFTKLAFAHPFLTPERDEYVMFHAQAAALRSSEPGRQVGAVIADSDGNIIAVGTNEVPKSGGGLLWPGDQPDHREHTLGFDSSEAYKAKLLTEVFEDLKVSGWLAESWQNKTAAALAREATARESPVVGKQRLVRNVIEFGRAVHAEMAAIDDAARRGVAIEGCTMFVTTFPCHLCARHIIASGIKHVRYIEPYPRSLAAELYPQCVSVEPDESADPQQVDFRPFLGVAPRQYLRLFTALERKLPSGQLAEFKPREAQPRGIAFEPLYLKREDAAVVRLRDALKKFVNEF